MPFTEDFTAGSDETLDSRTGWAIAPGESEGAVRGLADAATDQFKSDSGGGGTGGTFYVCTDQGNANSYVQIQQITLTPYDSFWFLRYADTTHYAAYYLAGTGASGARLFLRYGATSDDTQIRWQGAVNQYVRIEADGNDFEVFADSSNPPTTSISTWNDSGGELAGNTRHGVRCNASTGTDEPQDNFEAGVLSAGGSAAVTGTAADNISESDVVDGGKTVIITLTGDTWVAAGTIFDAVRQDIIDGLDSAQVEATGWNAEVRDKLAVTTVVRTSDTVVTVTLSAQASYDITAQETITVTVPASALVTSASPIIASPTFTVDPVGAATYFGHRPLMLAGMGA